jgi:hypothetical protein
MLAYWAEHAIGLHELLGLSEGHPADLGELVVVADEDLRAVGGPGGHIDHRASSDGVDAATDLLPCVNLEACLFLDLTDADHA